TQRSDAAIHLSDGATHRSDGVTHRSDAALFRFRPSGCLLPPNFLHNLTIDK
ncbi:MAG: hypothetical protein JST20_02610, partial [Bacteroidetes bacterium]|nr:hypothetical protein [Bacteroidota bacterium]